MFATLSLSPSYFSSTNTESLNALQAQFNVDSRAYKSDLMCGVYQTPEGKPYVLPSVKLVSGWFFLFFFFQNFQTRVSAI